MGENGMSVADVMALSNGNQNNGLFGGNGMWVFFLFFLLAWGNGGMFGGNNGQLTRSDITQGLNMQDVFRNQAEIKGDISDFERDATNFWGNIQTNMTAGISGINQNIAENRYAMQNGFCSIERNIDSVKYENERNTAEIINANAQNTQRILDAMTKNQIDSLRDELQTTRLTLGNNLQTQNILNALQPLPRPAYVTASPYASQNYCGCGL